jgi:hypothetical protein
MKEYGYSPSTPYPFLPPFISPRVSGYKYQLRARRLAAPETRLLESGEERSEVLEERNV